MVKSKWPNKVRIIPWCLKDVILQGSTKTCFEIYFLDMFKTYGNISSYRLVRLLCKWSAEVGKELTKGWQIFGKKHPPNIAQRLAQHRPNIGWMLVQNRPNVGPKSATLGRWTNRRWADHCSKVGPTYWCYLGSCFITYHFSCYCCTSKCRYLDRFGYYLCMI